MNTQIIILSPRERIITCIMSYINKYVFQRTCPISNQNRMTHDGLKYLLLGRNILRLKLKAPSIKNWKGFITIAQITLWCNGFAMQGLWKTKDRKSINLFMKVFHHGGEESKWISKQWIPSKRFLRKHPTLLFRPSEIYDP